MSIEPREFRRVLGQFASGVTVVTVKVGDELHGMTASAVSSVSLVPPLVLCCVDHKTRLHRFLDEGKTDGFALSFLRADQVDLSNHFAGLERMEPSPFETRRIRLGASGAPIFEESVAWVDCHLHSRLAAGDHTIYVGLVLDLSVVDDAAAPLVYFRGRYGTVGPV